MSNSWTDDAIAKQERDAAGVPRRMMDAYAGNTSFPTVRDEYRLEQEREEAKEPNATEATLVDRLRDYRAKEQYRTLPLGKIAELIDEAADKIEELEHENAMLRVQVSNAHNRAEHYRISSGGCTGGGL